MRVAFVSVSDQMGGSEAVLLQLMEQLRALRPGWPLALISPGGGPMSAGAATLGVAAHAVPMPPAIARFGDWGGRKGAAFAAGLAAAALALPAYERRFRRVLSSLVPDVVHSNGFKAHVLAARAPVGARRLWHLHEYVGARPVTRRLLRHHASRCDAVVANSASVAADVRSALEGRFAGAPAVIPNGVDLARFHPEGPAADLDAMCGMAPAPAGTVRVGLVATFGRWKGHDVFLRAVARLPPGAPVRAYVVGGPVYDTGSSQHSIEEVRGMARAAGCDGRVGFAGFRRDAPAAMRALDVVVHASTAPEPFGLVLIEAMACGRALVSSALGGSAEIVRPDVNAIVHRAGDPVSLADAIHRLAADAALRQRIGAAGRSTVEAHYDARRFGEAFVHAYEQLAGGAR